VNQLHDEAHGTADRTVVLDQLFELAGLLGEYMERGLADRRLTRARAEVIWRLQRDGPVTQRALSQALRVTPRNVTGLLDALETGGFLARRPHPSDRRAVLVTLTRRGKAAATALEADHRRFAEELFAGTGDAELTRFGRSLEQILGGLRREVLAGYPELPT
jgi:DNA-binding MarR family transcriptional regulator